MALQAKRVALPGQACRRYAHHPAQNALHGSDRRALHCTRCDAAHQSQPTSKEAPCVRQSRPAEYDALMQSNNSCWSEALNPVEKSTVHTADSIRVQCFATSTCATVQHVITLTHNRSWRSICISYMPKPDSHTQQGESHKSMHPLSGHALQAVCHKTSGFTSTLPWWAEPAAAGCAVH